MNFIKYILFIYILWNIIFPFIGNVVNKLANLRNLLNRADFDCGNGPAFSQSNDCDCVENAAYFVKHAVSGSKANLVKQANRSAIKLIKRLRKTYCTNEPVFNPANQGAPHPIGNKPADPQDPRPADHQVHKYSKKCKSLVT